MRVSSDHTTENQIAYIAVSRRFRKSLTKAKNKWEADADSDHNLVVAELWLKMVLTGKKLKQQ
jgi:hypothetical protein